MATSVLLAGRYLAGIFRPSLQDSGMHFKWKSSFRKQLKDLSKNAIFKRWQNVINVKSYFSAVEIIWESAVGSRETRKRTAMDWWTNESYSSLSMLNWGAKASKWHISITTDGRVSWRSFGAKRSHTDFRSTTSALHNDTKLESARVAIVALLGLVFPSEELSKSEITDSSSAPYLSALNRILRIFKRKLI